MEFIFKIFKPVDCVPGIKRYFNNLFLPPEQFFVLIFKDSLFIIYKSRLK